MLTSFGRAVARAAFLACVAAPASAALQVELVKDICPGPCGGIDYSVTPMFAATSTKLFFLAAPVDDGTAYVEYNVWVTDGTAAGTFQLHDPFPNNKYSRHAGLTRVGERVYFNAHKPTEWGVYESDGTLAGTREVPFPDAAFGNRYADAILDRNGEAWLTVDGVLYRIPSLGAAPVPVTTFHPASIKPMVLRNGAFYGYGKSCKACVEPLALWRIQPDGSKSPVNGFPLDRMAWIEDGPGGLFASAWSDASQSYELWHVPDAGAPRAFHSGDGFVVDSQGTHAGRWHFTDESIQNGTQLWSTDGTVAGTRKLTNLPTTNYSPQSFFLTTYRGERYGSADLNASSTLFRVDNGHPQGAKQVRRFEEASPAYAGNAFIVYEDRMFFAVIGGGDVDLWSSDGTPGGTQKVPMPGGPQPDEYQAPIAVMNGWLYFKRVTANQGGELWRLRGQPSDFRVLPTQHVVEFYNPSRDHYFLTGKPDEIAGLDAGVFPGWQRTGEGFTTYGPGANDPESGPVCRFYGLPSAGLDSHFYSSFSAECQDLHARFGWAWFLETWETFDVAQARSDGSCPAGFVPLYRTFNQRPDFNHRYTTDLAIQNQMAAGGWRREGLGAGVAMCVLARDSGQ